MNERLMRYAEETRRSFQGYDDVRDAGLTTPENIVRHDNIPYGDGICMLDVYHTKNVTAPQKTIVSVHGGAFVYGDKERYQYYCMDLAQRGFTVVNFTYRLAPEHPYPAQLLDVNAVFHWIAANGKGYQIDKECLFVVGDSAGAQLTHQYLTALTNPAYAALCGLETPAVRVRGCGLNCGLYALSPEAGEMFEAFMQDGAAAYAPQLDVFAHMTPDFPPAFVMTAWYDFLREAAPPLLARLDALGVRREYRLYGTADEPEMAHVFHLNLRSPAATRCNDEECAFFSTLAEWPKTTQIQENRPVHQCRTAFYIVPHETIVDNFVSFVRNMRSFHSAVRIFRQK